MEKKKPKTDRQRNSYHVFFEDVAEMLNDAGLDQRKVLKPEIDIPWDKNSVKNRLWRPIQKIITSKESTEDLTTDEVTKIYEVINRFLSEKHKIHIPFPSKDKQ